MSGHSDGAVLLDTCALMLIATARHLNAPIVTRDRRILAYAESGDVAAHACLGSYQRPERLPRPRSVGPLVCY